MIDRLESDLKDALKSRDKLRVTVLRSIKAAFINERIELGHELNESEALTVLKREAKKRQEAADMYKKAASTDKAHAELAEKEIIEEYLPEQMSEEEVIKHVEAAIEKLGAQSPQDMGKVMGYLSKELEGRADNSVVAANVKRILQK